MGLIVRNMTDSYGTEHPEAFLLVDILRSKRMFEGLRVVLRFFHSYEAFLAGFPPLPIIEFDIKSTTKVYSDRFSTEKTLLENVSDYTLIYDFLRGLNGTKESVTFTKPEVRTFKAAAVDESGAPVFDEYGQQIFTDRSSVVDVVDMTLATLSGIDFTQSYSTFSQAEIAAGGLDGLPSGRPVFCEDTRTIWGFSNGAYTDTSMTVSEFSSQ